VLRYTLLTSYLIGVKEAESGGDVLEVCPTMPEDFDPGMAIAFAPQEAAELGNPADGLPERGRLFGQMALFVDEGVKGLPFG
jgi:hypothetical protein